MNEITLAVFRNFTEDPNDTVGQERLHRERAKLLHNLVDTLDLPVENWGTTDSARPHEVVEIIVALGSAGVFTALVTIAKVWIEKMKIPDVELKGPNGTISLKGATASDVIAIARQIGFEIRN